MNNQSNADNNAERTILQTPELLPPQQPMTEEEKKEFNEHLVAVKTTAAANADLACRLHEIKDRKLYRDSYPTWEAFCGEVLHLTSVAVNNQIKTYQLRRLLLENGISPSLLPVNDRPLRPLMAVKSAETTVSIFKEAAAQAEGKPVTEDLLAKAVKKFSELGPAVQSLADGMKTKTNNNAKVLKLVAEVTAMLPAVQVEDLPLIDVAKIKLLKTVLTAVETACNAATTVSSTSMQEAGVAA